MTREQVRGFKLAPFTHEGRTRDVYVGGQGQAVIVIHEMPGLHPGVIAFGQRVVDAGYKVYMPSLFGRPNAPPSTGAFVRSMVQVCVKREFAKLANRTSPITGWLKALATEAHEDCGGPGVGAVGMCFTGGYALAMAVEPAVLAPVLSQPSVPFPMTQRKRRQLGLDGGDLAKVKERTQQGLSVLGLRFTCDALSPGARFDTLRDELGEGFESIEIDSCAGNANDIPKKAHAVLTVDLVDEPGHPTRAALDRVIAFLDERLKPTPRP